VKSRLKVDVAAFGNKEAIPIWQVRPHDLTGGWLLAFILVMIQLFRSGYFVKTVNVSPVVESSGAPFYLSHNSLSLYITHAKT
jgi:hypothetical protein